MNDKEPELKLKTDVPNCTLPPITNHANITSNLGYEEEAGFSNPMVNYFLATPHKFYRKNQKIKWLMKRKNQN